jgi:hypothetical protein
MAFNQARKVKPIAPRLNQHYQLMNQPHNDSFDHNNKQGRETKNSEPIVDEPESDNETSKLVIEDISPKSTADEINYEEKEVKDLDKNEHETGQEQLICESESINKPNEEEVESDKQKQTSILETETDDMEFIDTPTTNE